MTALSKFKEEELHLVLIPGGNTPHSRKENFDITDRVFELGPINNESDVICGEPQAESVRLRLFGGDIPGASAIGSFFERYDTFYLNILKSGESVFFGVNDGQPRVELDYETGIINLCFVGGLKTLWDSGCRLTEGEGISYASAETELWPLLIETAKLPITAHSILLDPITTREDVWSTVARPKLDFAGYDEYVIARWDIVSPVCGTVKNSVYAGFGPFILSYDIDIGQWKVIAKVVADWDVTWYVGYLEYDSPSNILYGLTVPEETEVTEPTAHLRAGFALEL